MATAAVRDGCLATVNAQMVIDGGGNVFGMESPIADIGPLVVGLADRLGDDNEGHDGLR